MIIIGIIISILLFSIIVIIHELGHFGAARFFQVKVDEFGLGIPPRAKKLFKDKKGTLYSLNWLPLGGFVRLRGENKETLKNKDDEKAFINKSAGKQMIIILAGVFMNFVFAFIIFSILFFIGVKPIGINTKLETDLKLKIIPTFEQAIESGLLSQKEGIVLFPVEGSIAKKAGIKEGFILEKINNIKIEKKEELIEEISRNSGKEIVLEGIEKNPDYKEGCECIENYPFKISLTVGEDGKIGSYLSDNFELNEDFKYKYSFLGAIKNGAEETYNQTLLTFKGLSYLLKNIIVPETPKERTEAIQNVSGPIGIVDFITSSLSAGVIYFLIIGAIISINLGLFNLLPIPALDGGRFIFIFLNWIILKITGKKFINEKVEGLVHVLFFIFLIAISLIIAYNDIIKIINS